MSTIQGYLRKPKLKACKIKVKIILVTVKSRIRQQVEVTVPFTEQSHTHQAPRAAREKPRVSIGPEAIFKEWTVSPHIHSDKYNGLYNQQWPDLPPLLSLSLLEAQMITVTVVT